MKELRLADPAKEHEAKAFEYIAEFKKHKSEIKGTGGLERFTDYDAWLLKLEDDHIVDKVKTGRVPSYTYFYIRDFDEKIIGMINIRQELNYFLLVEGGHLGYSIRPSERNKGYATKLLKAGLDKCREMGIEKVLVTCDKNNYASKKVIKNNGGVLENELFSETYKRHIERYWIDLK